MDNTCHLGCGDVKGEWDNLKKWANSDKSNSQEESYWAYEEGLKPNSQPGIPLCMLTKRICQVSLILRKSDRKLWLCYTGSLPFGLFLIILPVPIQS